MKPMLAIMLVLGTLSMSAEKVKKVTAEYVYYAPENISVDEAKRIALERAKLQAIADEFGTVVSQTSSTRVINNSSQSTVDFVSVGASEVKGEWVETLSDPKYEVLYEDGQLAVAVSIKGSIRKFTTEHIDFKVATLRNGTNDDCESTEFTDGDQLFLRFQSPIKGYLLVYLLDEAEKKVYQMLPYGSSVAPAWEISDDKAHILFSIEHAPYSVKSEVDEYIMTSESPKSYNDIYVLFSPEPMTHALSSPDRGSESAPKQLSVKEFRKWLNKNRSVNPKLNLSVIPLTITKQS